MFRIKNVFIYVPLVLVLSLILGCGGEDKTTKAINAGKPFTVIFDVDYDVFPKGSTFEVQLKNGKFEATGIRKGNTVPETHLYALGKEASNYPNCISIWGATFQYDKNNNLLLDNKILGRLALKEK